MPLCRPQTKKRTVLLCELKAVFQRVRSQSITRVTQGINHILRGWVNHFAVGHASRCFSFIRNCVELRNPHRDPPPGEGILGPADATVVYVKKIEPHEDVISIKKGTRAKLADILHEDAGSAKLLIGIFMSPFNVHYNRAPLAGEVEFVRHHPGRGPNLHMGPMHWRILLRREPYYENGMHIVHNERTVTKINGQFNGAVLPCYVIQIAAKNVDGIDSYVHPGEFVQKGAIFGMIRIGSQVDIVVPWTDDMRIHVRPGDKVRAGQTILVS